MVSAPARALDQLDEIPALAREASEALTGQRRGDQSGRRSHPGPSEPINLTAFGLFRGDQPAVVADPVGEDPDSHLLWELYEATRVVTYEAGEAGYVLRQGNPLVVDWAGLCAFLAATFDFWGQQRLSCEWVTSSVGHVHTTLSRYARVTREPVLLCRHIGNNGDECGYRLTEQVGRYRCEVGHEITRKAALRNAAGEQWLPLAEALRAVEKNYQLAVPPLRTVRQWGNRGQLDEIRRRDSRGWWMYHVAGLWQHCAKRMLDPKSKSA